MQNKKIIVLVSFVIVLSLIIFLATFNKQKESNIDTNQTGATEVDMTELCDFDTNEDIYRKAVENKDKKVCPCLRNKNEIENCLNTIDDFVLYERILSENDLSICDGIKNDEMKKGCVNIGESRMEYLNNLKKESPQVEAGRNIPQELAADENE